MRALTLTQPWAGLVASGIKLIENRSRRPPSNMLGEQFAIHASRENKQETWRRIIEIDPRWAIDYPGPVADRARLYPLTTTTSCVIGVATLVTYVTDARQIAEYTSPEQERWFFGPVGFVLSNVVALRDPIACKGALGFWRLGEDVEKKVRAQL